MTTTLVRRLVQTSLSDHTEAERNLLLHAFAKNPATVWTASGLSDWYGVRLDRVGRYLEEMSMLGEICPADPSRHTFRFNRRRFPRPAKPVTKES